MDPPSPQKDDRNHPGSEPTPLPSRYDSIQDLATSANHNHTQHHHAINRMTSRGPQRARASRTNIYILGRTKTTRNHHRNNIYVAERASTAARRVRAQAQQEERQLALEQEVRLLQAILNGRRLYAQILNLTHGLPRNLPQRIFGFSIGMVLGFGLFHGLGGVYAMLR